MSQNILTTSHYNYGKPHFFKRHGLWVVTQHRHEIISFINLEGKRRRQLGESRWTMAIGMTPAEALQNVKTQVFNILVDPQTLSLFKLRSPK